MALHAGTAHEAVVARLNELFGKVVGVAALVWPQGNAIRRPQTDTQPQPDITILRRRNDYYARKPPVVDDVILMVEVAESSLKYDRGYKLTLYAEAGIPDYRIVNLPKSVVEVYTEPDPGAGKYQSVTIARRDEKSVAVNDVLG